MLNRIEIKNYALIENLEINFDEGLNVVTGETGAGKSIIIDAISLLLGQRGNKDNIRSGAEKMMVQGLFDVKDNPGVLPLLEENGLPVEDNELIISRIIDRSGKNTCRINGVLVTVGQLKALGDHLIDIHSQHETHALFTAASHRQLLDAFGGQHSADLLAQTAHCTAKLKEQRQNILAAEQKGRTLADQKDRLARAVKEIRAVDPQPEEDLQCEAQLAILANGEALAKVSQSAYHLLNGRDEETNGLIQSLEMLSEQFKRLSGLDEQFRPWMTRCGEMTAELKEFGSELERYIDRLDFSPEALDQVQERLAQLTGLKRRYGDTLARVMDYGRQAEGELALAEDFTGVMQQLKKDYMVLWDDYKKTAGCLHEYRAETALLLARALENELKDLAMERAVVQVDIDRDEQRISSGGQDHVEFLMAVNPGTPPRQIRKAASGGEISRIMLALKCLFADAEPWITMIFDEIDTGISGRTAQKVAEKILKCSGSHQIICITHLPQIAALADRHFTVVKDAGEASTQVHFNTLSAEERTEELSRMLSGAKVTQTARDHAREMLALSAELKGTKS